MNVEKTTKHIIIRFGVGDPDPWRAAYKALETALNMKRLLEEMAGYKLGEPIQIGKPKWEIIGDPVAGEVAKKQVVVTDSGAIDNTPDPGTLHFYDPEDVVTYLRMPKEVRKIHQEIAEVKKEFRQMPETIAVMMKEWQLILGKRWLQQLLKHRQKPKRRRILIGSLMVMRRISRRLICEVAESLMSDGKTVSQHEVHREIEKRIGRKLTKHEKSSVTLILRVNYSIVRRERRGNTRIVYFQW